MKPLWLYRPVINTPDLYRWCALVGIKKMYPEDQLHMTLATVRQPVEWGDLDLQTDELIVPAGFKAIQIIGWTVKALTFGHPAVKARHEELLARFPKMDHPLLRPHVSLYRGGKMIHEGYEGELVFGPERAEIFDEVKGRGIKHIRVSEACSSV